MPLLTSIYRHCLIARAERTDIFYTGIGGEGVGVAEAGMDAKMFGARDEWPSGPNGRL